MRKAGQRSTSLRPSERDGHVPRRRCPLQAVAGGRGGAGLAPAELRGAAPAVRGSPGAGCRPGKYAARGVSASRGGDRGSPGVSAGQVDAGGEGEKEEPGSAPAVEGEGRGGAAARAPAREGEGREPPLNARRAGRRERGASVGRGAAV